jgi:hypothetical protein
VLSDTSVLALRYGWTQFVRHSTMTIDFDPMTLGFSPTFGSQVSQTGVPKFPRGVLTGYAQSGNTFGQIKSVVSHLQVVGRERQLLEVRRYAHVQDGRRLPPDRRVSLEPGNASGEFQFDNEFTSATGPQQNSTTEGDAFASFLLGYPKRGRRASEHDDADHTLDIYTNYYSGYWSGRLADRLEVHADLRAARRARRGHP